MTINESDVEAAALSWFSDLGYPVANGLHIAPGEPAAERAAFGDVTFVGRLADAIRRLNPHIPADAHVEHLTAARAVARTQCSDQPD